MRTKKSIQKKISLSKKEFMESMWISYDKRKPPNTDDGILGWNYKLKKALLVSGRILNAQHDQLQSKKIILEKLAEDKYMWHTGYFINKWMPIYGPKE